MRLSQLEARFVRYETRPHPSQAAGWTSEYLVKVDSLAEAQGIKMMCPACFIRNSGPIGTHWIEVSFAGKGVKDHQGSRDREGKPSRWDVSGAGYEDLTLRPSILIDQAKPACDGWHGFVTNGDAS